MTVAIRIPSICSRTLDFEGPGTTPAQRERHRLLERLSELRAGLNQCDWQCVDLLLRATSICLQLDRIREAVDLLQRALFIDRNNAWARAKIGELCSEDEIREMQLPAPARPLSKNRSAPFLWPLRGEGLWILCIGAMLFTPLVAMLDFVSYFSIFGALIWVTLSLLLGGFLADYFGSVVRSTAADHHHAPDWPLWDFGQYLLAIQIACVPFALLLPGILWWAVANPIAPDYPVVYGLVLAILCMPGLILLPMALLIFSVRRSLSEAVNPLMLFEALRSAGTEYRSALEIWSLSCYAPVLFSYLIYSAFPLNGLASCTPLLLYALMVGGRTLGMLHQSCRENLRW